MTTDGHLKLTDQTNILPTKKVITCFMGLSLCLLVTALDTVSVATALPTIGAAFHAGSIVSWVPASYLLTTTCFQPLYGRFSDIFGRKAALTAAMITYMIGNLLAGFSKTIIQLIVFRGIAGAGGGGILNLCQIVISDIVTLRERGKYQGITGGVMAIGYAIGPIIGGGLSEKVTWRWAFWITIPISAVALVTVLVVLPLKPVTGDMKKKLLAIDWVGAGLTLVACALVILPIIWGGVTFPWSSAIVLATLFSGLFTCVLFCLWEWKGARLPIVPMYIFKKMTVSGVYISTFIYGYIQISTVYYLPQYFQVVMRYGPVHAGVFLIPFLVPISILSWVSGLLVSRTGRYCTIIQSGFAIFTIALGCISTIHVGSSKAVLVILMLLGGAGAGQTLQTSTIAAQAASAKKDMAVVTAFRNFVRSLGSTFCVAVGSTIINNALRSAMDPLGLAPALIKAVINDPTTLADPAKLGISQAVADIILTEGYRKGFRIVFILNASLGALATVSSIVMIRHKDLANRDAKPATPDSGTVTPAYSEMITPGTSGTVTPAELNEKYKESNVSSTIEEVDLDETVARVKAEISNV